MKDSGWNVLIFFTFITIFVLIIVGGIYYEKEKEKNYYNSLYNELTDSMLKKVKTLISEKENATLTISLSQSKNSDIIDALLNKVDSREFLKELSLQLRRETDFKNVWFQILNKEGVSVARSWTDKIGDDLSLIRKDIISMRNKPEVKTSISVGKFDISFKAMVPIFSKSGEYIGAFETITHFNSIAKKIEDDGFYPLILVDKKYTNQIKYPFSKLFVNGHYVANSDANKKYLDLIAKDGINKFISSDNNFVVDTQSQSMVVNYTFFDNSNMPMANFLMFKPLNKIDVSSLGSIKSIINLIMFFSSIIVMGLFLFLFKRDISSKDDSIEKFKYVGSFTVLFLFLSFGYYKFLVWSYQDSKDKYLKEHNKNIYTDYFIVHQKFNSLAQTMYEIALNNKEVKNLLKKAYISEELKNENRKKLYNLLIDKYEFLKELNLRQLHFHLKNNESFLRFHRPQKYGDNLTNIRATVDWVNKNYQPIAGFEEGRIYNGFRNVFPISYTDYTTGQKHHLGSVETSFSPYAIANEFIKSHNVKATFIIDSEVVDTKVFNDEQLNYRQSEFKNFYYEKTIEEQLKHAVKQINIKNISNKDLAFANEKIFDAEIFSVASKNNTFLYTFIPIKNPVSNKVVAAIILQYDNIVLQEQKNSFLLLLFVGVSSFVIMLLFVYREYISKKKLKEISLKTRQILDTQDSMVLTTDSDNLHDANRQFLNFFGYPSVKKFKEDYDCVCDRFMEADGYYYISSDNENWLYSLKSLPKKQRIILMSDANNMEHSFAVSFSAFGKSDYIVTFTDISHTIKEQLILEKKLVQDKLTGAYNREFFDKNIDLLIEASKQRGDTLGLIIFDIDNFKIINDTYGHNQGDMVLQELTKCINSSIRKNDYLIRWGGEEFIVIFDTKSIVESKKMAEYLRIKIESLELKDVGHITCSFGVTVINTDESILQNIESADKALYEAKNNGKNMVVVNPST